MNRTKAETASTESGMYVLPDEPRKQAAIPRECSAAALEELLGALGFFGSRSCVEGAEVPALARLRVLLARVEAIFARGKFPDHVLVTRIA